jgi:DNA-binding transcriptional ArsR family regulator
MQRIHFTPADFARVRLRPTVGPLVESAFAYGLLGRGVGAPFARWRSQVAERLTQWPLPLSGGGAALGLEGFLDLIERSGRSVSTETATDRTAPALPFHPAAGDLSQVWRAAVAPYWEHVRGYLEAECEARGRVLMAGGVELLLATLHSKITWEAPVLEIHDGPDEDISLDGRGLVLSPSVFLAQRPGRVTRRLAENGSVVLAFAAPPDPRQAAALWDEPDDSGQPLGALVGQTRASALHALRSSCTTGQLADRLGISAAGASQHTAVLRRAGLITTRRIRNTVLHTLTPLGVALLKGMSPRPAAAAGVRMPARRPAAVEVRRYEPLPMKELAVRTTPAA